MLELFIFMREVANIALAVGAAAVVGFTGAEQCAAAVALAVGGFIVGRIALAHAAAAAGCMGSMGVGGDADRQAAAFAPGMVCGIIFVLAGVDAADTLFMLGNYKVFIAAECAAGAGRMALGAPRAAVGFAALDAGGAVLFVIISGNTGGCEAKLAGGGMIAFTGVGAAIDAEIVGARPIFLGAAAQSAAFAGIVLRRAAVSFIANPDAAAFAGLMADGTEAELAADPAAVFAGFMVFGIFIIGITAVCIAERAEIMEFCGGTTAGTGSCRSDSLGRGNGGQEQGCSQHQDRDQAFLHGHSSIQNMYVCD